MSDVLEVVDLAGLDSVFEENAVTVVDFADPVGCMPCKQFAPHFTAAAERSTAAFVHVDVRRADVELLSKYGIQRVPTVLAFRGEELIGPVESRTAIPLLREVESL